MDALRQQRHASNELEELIIAAKEVVLKLREGQSSPKAYALVSRLRWRMGQIVAMLGPVGVPLKGDREWAKDIIDSSIWVENGGRKE